MVPRGPAAHTIDGEKMRPAAALLLLLLLLLLLHLLAAAAALASARVVDFRIARAFETYDLARVTEISRPGSIDALFCPAFALKWSDRFHVCTRLVKLTPGATTRVSIGAGFHSVEVRLPLEGGSVGFIPIADPCFSSKWVLCSYGTAYQVFNTTISFLNHALADPRVHMFGILGDNFYDQSGELSGTFFDALSPRAKSKFFTSVPGNHDFWIAGGPEGSVPEDQFGYGYLQFYGQDSLASRNRRSDFGLDPSSMNPRVPLPAEYFFTSFRLGGLGFIGFTSNQPLDFARFDEACASHASKSEFVFLLNHWSHENLGCIEGMHAPGVAAALAARKNSACSLLASQGRLLYLMGHRHSNEVFPGQVMGFQVAGFGMAGNGEFGFPLIEYQAAQKRLLVRYFPLALHAMDSAVHSRWSTLRGCLERGNGVFACAESLAVVWLNRTVAPVEAVQ